MGAFGVTRDAETEIKLSVGVTERRLSPRNRGTEFLGSIDDCLPMQVWTRQSRFATGRSADRAPRRVKPPS